VLTPAIALFARKIDAINSPTPNNPSPQSRGSHRPRLRGAIGTPKCKNAESPVVRSSTKRCPNQFRATTMAMPLSATPLLTAEAANKSKQGSLRIYSVRPKRQEQALQALATSQPSHHRMPISPHLREATAVVNNATTCPPPAGQRVAHSDAGDREDGCLEYSFRIGGNRAAISAP